MRLSAIALLGLLLCSACGFHLRSWDLTSAVSSAHVTSERRNFLAEPLRKGLDQAGVELSARAGDAELVVQLVEERKERRSVSVTGQARAAEYELTMAVHFSVHDTVEGEARVLIEPRWVETTRVYRVDADNIVGNSEEQTLLESEMVNDLVQQVIRVLNAVSRETGVDS